MVGFAVVGFEVHGASVTGAVLTGAKVVAGAADGEANEGAVELHNFESADILLKMVCMMEFDTRLRFAPSPMKLPLKLTA